MRLMPDILLRGLADPLHGDLREAARRNRRSLNAEIVARLEASFHVQRLDVEGLLARVRERVARSSIPDLDDAALRALKEEGRA